MRYTMIQAHLSERTFMPSVNYATYYHYDQLVQTLHAWVQEYPTLASLQSIGTSYEGRDLWLMTLTNQGTGAPTDKPSFWLDANIHATEVTGSMAALHVIDTLLSGYGTDQHCTHLLDATTLYVLPRFNPDGAERALTTPHGVRSSVRPYPHQERKDGLYAHDLNGDGLILQMRMVDPNGDWCVSDADPRVMLKRRPDDMDGTFYRIFPEGLIQNYDGVSIKLSPALEGLDINRNFPFNWRPEADQRGAGPYPTSEPEIRAVVQFLTEHPEIHGAITYHTFSGALLRPHSDRPDDDFDYHDLSVYKAIGQRGTDLTGYPHISVYHDFRYHPKEVITGVFDDWVYNHLGIFAFTVELWDMVGEAGIKERKFIEWFKDHPEEDELKLLRWNDEQANGEAFIDWQPFEHPQLGPVEIGGWHPMYAFRNPPPAMLQAECEKNTPFVLAQAAMAPLLTITSLQAEALGDDVYRVRAVIQNNGFLPTYGSVQARKQHACRPLEARLQLATRMTLELGELKQEIEHLEGRSQRLERNASGATTDRTKLEWIIRAPQGGTLMVIVSGGRGGSAHAEHTLADPSAGGVLSTNVIITTG